MKKYDLEERTTNFSVSIVKFAEQIYVNPIRRSLADQLTRSGTSIGANYCEANHAGSRRDFTYKIGICRKEAKETIYWLRVVKSLMPLNNEIEKLLQEAKELTLIFSSIYLHSRNKKPTV
ncbi:four helix bundle protein [Candidatus Peregrinibacteria bacterium]|nr:four helix bundle protein [Candidatus Peregrinibacteria bacterium]